MLRFISAGESHGKALLAVLEGLPAGLKLDCEQINHQLKRRQAGFGRGGRMQIESDRAQILCGLKKNITLGSPLGMLIENKDSSIEELPRITCPRPGHADLSGLLKYGFSDARNVLERASARETAARVAAGAVCMALLKEFGIAISSRVVMIGGETDGKKMCDKIVEARDRKDTVGGIFDVNIKGVVAGLGSYVQWDRRLDANLARMVVSIPGIKAVEFGLGSGYASKLGSECHDAIYYTRQKGYFRKTNSAGGIEGGVSNGEPIVLRAVMKPISTLLKPLDSVNIVSRKAAKATVERSDVCAVESAGVVAESCCAYVLAGALLEKFGGDCLVDIKASYASYKKRIR